MSSFDGYDYDPYLDGPLPATNKTEMCPATSEFPDSDDEPALVEELMIEHEHTILSIKIKVKLEIKIKIKV